MNDKNYTEKDYIVEKRITTDDNTLVNDFYFEGVNFYILKLKGINSRFAYVTNDELYENQIIVGKSLLFTDIEDTNTNHNLKKCRDSFRDIYFELSSSKKNSISFNIKEIFFKEIHKEGRKIYINKNKIHLKKLVFDNKLWAKEYLVDLGYNSLTKKFQNTLSADSLFDSRIMDIAKTQLFVMKGNKYMIYNDHKIILTQGGTGKSSILGVLGSSVEDVSEAGIYGYSNPTKNVWISGKVSNTNDSILIDETNELIKKNNGTSGLLKNLNTPLEQGKFASGKASGETILFGNQFLFLGNVSNDFNFEQFVEGVFTNTETIGRRFGYLLYDNNVTFVAGTKLRPNEQNIFIKSLKSYCSDLIRFFLVTRKFNTKFFDKHSILILDKFENEVNKLIQQTEMPMTKQFIMEYKKSKKRLCIMALKLSIFDNLDEIYKTDVTKFPLTKISVAYRVNLKRICNDIAKSIQNIITHTSDSIIANNQEHNKNKLLKTLNKNQLKVVGILISNIDKFDKNILNYENIEHKKTIKDFIFRCRTNASVMLKNNKLFGTLGFRINQKSKELEFVVTNKKMFENTIILLSSHFVEL